MTETLSRPTGADDAMSLEQHSDLEATADMHREAWHREMSRAVDAVKFLERLDPQQLRLARDTASGRCGEDAIDAYLDNRRHHLLRSMLEGR